MDPEKLMANSPTQERPRELRVATALLWVAIVLGIVADIIDFTHTPAQGLVFIFAWVFAAGFVLVGSVATYFFSLGRKWARIASLILFLMNLVGMLALPSIFSESPIVGWLFVGGLLAQALAMYIAFATPASKSFRHTPDGAAMRAILPVGRSGWAIAAGYLALFSVLLVPAPFALACGLMGIRDIRRHPEKHGMGRSIFGVVMGSLGVLALLALLGFRLAR